MKDIEITVVRENNSNLVQAHKLSSEKGKFSFTINDEESSNYRVCIKNTKGWSQNHLKDISVRLVINSDNMDDPDLSKTIATVDVNPVKEKLSQAIMRVSILL